MRCANCGNEDENTLWDEGDMLSMITQFVNGINS